VDVKILIEPLSFPANLKPLTHFTDSFALVTRIKMMSLL